MSSFIRLLGRVLDLDDPQIDKIQLEYREEGVPPGSTEGPDVESYAVWLSVLLLTALEHAATSIEIRIDRANQCLQQRFLAPRSDNPNTTSWLECVPMEWWPKNKSLDAIRYMAGILLWRQHGRLRYRYGGRMCKARCFRSGPDQITISLADACRGEVVSHGA